MRDRNPGRIIKVGNERMTTKGYNPPKPDPWASMYPQTVADEPEVAHEDVDNDDQRKMNNNMRHSSYRR